MRLANALCRFAELAAEVRSRFESVVSPALHSAAAAMEARSAETTSAGLERDLKRVLCDALCRLRPDGTPLTTPRLEGKVDLGARWPNVGRVDLVLDDEKTLVELKWGTGTLYNCVWDVAKLGCALGAGVADHACVLAGAPAIDWIQALGSELFAKGSWPLEDLRTRYLKYWRFWEQDVPTTRPFELPSVVCTRPVAVASCEIDGAPWELRCCAVELDRWSWTPWPSTR